MSPAKPKASTRRSMSASHKAALAKGREEGIVVRRYLEALEAVRPRRGRRRALSTIEKRLTAIDTQLEHAEPLSRLHLLQQKKDLEAELNRSSERTEIDALEDQFVDVAAAYGERKGISYSTWRAAGVPASVLQRAGIARTRR